MKTRESNIRSAVIAALSATMAGGRPSGATMDRSLSACGFLAPRQAAANLVALAGRALEARGDPAHAEEDMTALLTSCADAPSPDDALRNLDRFLERSGGISAFLSATMVAPPFRSMLTMLFGASQYMADILVRSPGLAYWLNEQRTWNISLERESLAGQLKPEPSPFGSFESRLDAIRRAYRRSLLVIGARDLVQRVSIEETTRHLSDLAEATVNAVLECVSETIPAPSGGGDTLAIIAMGKLGGRELNYSSDIDVVFVCDGASDEDTDRYTQIARGVIDALATSTAEGYLYRVDLRLRPDGKAGPLVTTMPAARLYYENRGRPWEFQAMLKARVIAGNQQVGSAFLHLLSRLIFSHSLSYSPIDSIATTRAQIHESLPAHGRGFNIKLMEGGIRDVEFITQTIQLMHGAGAPDVRGTNTLDALKAIVKRGYLQRWEAENLAGAYRFFRLVEHRMQMMHQIKTHTVPADEAGVALLARRCAAGPLGSYTRTTFLQTLANHLGNVRAIAEGFFSDSKVHPHSALLMLPPDDERTQRILGQYGLSDTRRAIGALNTMAHGSFPRLLDRNTRRAFEEALPVILEGIAPSGEPDSTLVNLSRIASAGRNEAAFYRLLCDTPPARDFALFVAGMSSMLTSALCNQISLFESFARTTGSVASKTRVRHIADDDRFDLDAANAGGREAARRQQRQRAWFDRCRLYNFAAACGNGFAPVGDGPSRSTIASLQVAAAFDEAIGPQSGVAVFAMGSYATEEAQPNSDVDLLVVTDGADINEVTRRVHKVVRWFDEGRILKLDFRLRGEGENAPLVQSLDTYHSYFTTRMSAWERVAFARCRPWWGDQNIHHAFLGELDSIIEQPVRANDVEKLMGVRRRLEGLGPSRYGVWDTKRAAGGRYDIEYITYVGIGQHPRKGGSLGMSLRDRLTHLTSSGFLTDGEAAHCAGALDVFARVEYLMQLQRFSLPQSAKRHAKIETYLDRTLEWIGSPLPGGISTALVESKKNVRAVYEAVLSRSRD